MAHELTYNEQGTANVFSVREDMWHREGVVLAAAPTLREGMALAGHAFDVEVRPTFRRIITGQVNGVDVEDFVENTLGRVTVRTDTGAELGAVGLGYKPLQNTEAFSVLEPLLDAGVATLETGGTLRGGADVWLQVRFQLDRFGPTCREVFGEEVEPFGLIANNHNGRRGCLLQLTPIRVVCANTLGMSEHVSGLGMEEGDASAVSRKAIVVKHTTNVATRVVEAAEQLFHGLVQRYEVVAAQYRLLKATTLTTEEFTRAVEAVLAPDPRKSPRWNPEARMAATVVERYERKAARVRELWTGGAGHAGDYSAWEGYNAATEALDHDVELWPTRGGVFRTAAMLDGNYGQMKQQVLDNLVAIAAAR